MNDEQRKQVLAKYEHPITKEVGEKASNVAGHGKIDFIMDYHLVYCLRNGLKPNQDVYDAVECSCLTELMRGFFFVYHIHRYQQHVDNMIDF